jgi:hypothetical protein
MKVAFLVGFWLAVAMLLVCALDNLFVQPMVPGWLIGAACLASINVLFYEVKPFRLMRK